MIKTKIAYLNKEILVEEEEPSTIQELTTLVGEEGLVSNTIKNLRYRNKYPRVYARVSSEITQRGFPPQVKDKDKDDKPIYQDEMEHIRAYYTSGHKTEVEKMFERIANEEPLFIRGDRSGGGRVAQGALDAAHRYFAEGKDKVTDAVQTIEQMLPGYRVRRDAGELTPEDLARGIQTLQRHLTSKAKMVVQNL